MILATGDMEWLVFGLFLAVLSYGMRKAVKDGHGPTIAKGAFSLLSLFKKK